MAYTPDTPCACEEHQRCGTPTQYGDHVYLLQEDDSRGWRWLCSCGAKGRFTTQSPQVPYHSWEQHILKVFL